MGKKKLTSKNLLVYQESAETRFKWSRIHTCALHAGAAYGFLLTTSFLRPCFKSVFLKL